MFISNTALLLPVNHGKCLFISLVVQWTIQLIGRPIQMGKKRLNPRTACPMAEQIYPLTFEGRESNPRMLGGSGVLNTPLPATKLIDSYLLILTIPYDLLIQWNSYILFLPWFLQLIARKYWHRLMRISISEADNWSNLRSYMDKEVHCMDNV